MGSEKVRDEGGRVCASSLLAEEEPKGRGRTKKGSILVARRGRECCRRGKGRYESARMERKQASRTSDDVLDEQEGEGEGKTLNEERKGKRLHAALDAWRRC